MRRRRIRVARRQWSIPTELDIVQTTERFLRHGLSLIAFTMLALGATAPTSAAIRPITGDWDGDGSTNVAFWNDSIRRALFDVNEDGRIDGVSPDLGNP